MIQTDKTMKFNRLDITFTKKREKVTYLIDISIPNNINIEHRYNNKIEKYTPLVQEIQKNMGRTIIVHRIDDNSQ